MGKIIGLGGGRFDNGEMQNAAEYIFSLAGKANPVFTFLPTAAFDNCDENDATVTVFKKLGCDCKILKLTDKSLTRGEIEAIILGSDIIYADGGNLEFLMKTFRETGADKALKKAYDKGIILSGFSSGMMCWFAEGYDDCAPGGEFMWIDCIGILPYAACPHFEGGNWGSFADAVKGRRYSAFAMENGAALVYLDGKYSVICGNEGGRVYYFDKDRGHEKSIFGGEEQR